MILEVNNNTVLNYSPDQASNNFIRDIAGLNKKKREKYLSTLNNLFRHTILFIHDHEEISKKDKLKALKLISQEIFKLKFASGKRNNDFFEEFDINALEKLISSFEKISIPQGKTTNKNEITFESFFHKPEQIPIIEDFLANNEEEQFINKNRNWMTSSAKLIDSS